jgi:SMC interacting uncharacterized protein involved in chromosome segregation
VGLKRRLNTLGEEVHERLSLPMPTDEVTELKLDALKVQVNTAKEQLKGEIAEVAKDLADFKRFLTIIMTALVAPLLLLILAVMLQLLINRGN